MLLQWYKKKLGILKIVLLFLIYNAVVHKVQTFSYVMGDRGSGRCPNGYSTITDSSGCRKACDNKKISFGSEISGGHPCYMDGGRKCHQNGQNGGGASFLCRKPGIFSN